MKQLSLDPEQNLDMEIAEILAGNVGTRKLEKNERAMLELLRSHKGSSNAIQIAQIAPRLNTSDRNVKALAKSLIEDFGARIGASRQEPYGYYLCITADEIDSASRPLESEIRSLARRLRSLRGRARVIEMLGQLCLDVEKREIVEHKTG